MSNLNQLAQEFLSKKRIAVAGVSVSGDATAKSIYDKLKETGHEVFALNPNLTEVDGQPCYPNIQAVPGGVEAVVAVTTPAVTEQIVKDCVETGVQWVWMHRSIGNSVSEAAVQMCRDEGIHVLAGGCPMMYQEPVDFGHKCLRWWCGLTGKLPQD